MQELNCARKLVSKSRDTRGAQSRRDALVDVGAIASVRQKNDVRNAWGKVLRLL